MVAIRHNIFKSLILVLCFTVAGFLHPFSLYSDSSKERPHADHTKLPMKCASCHVGHGMINTPMLPETRATFCFRCHGDQGNTDKMKRSGLLSQHVTTIDIQHEFAKPYRHPIETTSFHRSGEVLPELDPSAPRHAACEDCHHHHLVAGDNKMSGIMGTTRRRVKVPVQNDYELCFNCHSYSTNLPINQTNKAELFDVTNPSFHPVLGPGRNRNVPSLINSLSPSSVIKCTDCHNNNDPSGPKGPHGSAYQHLLSKNFEDSDGAENLTRFELCYSCHRRDSILANASFYKHNLHVAQVGTSCRTCHNPHGSRHNMHLIDFDYSVSVRPSKSGRLEFIYLGERAGKCFLNCHDHEHDPAVYPLSAATPSATTLQKK